MHGTSYIPRRDGGRCDPTAIYSHANRPETYTPFDYFGEFGSVLEGLRQAGMQHVENMLIGPSIATGDWTPESTFMTLCPPFDRY